MSEESLFKSESEERIYKLNTQAKISTLKKNIKRMHQPPIPKKKKKKK